MQWLRCSHDKPLVLALVQALPTTQVSNAIDFKRGITMKSYTSRRLPPYGRVAQERIKDRANWPHWSGTSRDGSHLTLWAVTGAGAWEWARVHRDTRLFLLLPTDEEPEQYSWELLTDHDPVLLLALGDFDQAVVDRLAAAILRDGATRISLFGSGGVSYLAQRCAA